MKCLISIILATALIHSNCFAQEDIASLKSTKQSATPLEGLVIEIANDGSLMTDGGRLFHDLDELENFIRETKDTFAPVLVLNSRGKPEDMAIGLKALIIFQKSASSYSLIVE